MTAVIWIILLLINLPYPMQNKYYTHDLFSIASVYISTSNDHLKLFLLCTEVLLPCFSPMYERGDLYLHFPFAAAQKELSPFSLSHFK